MPPHSAGALTSHLAPAGLRPSWKAEPWGERAGRLTLYGLALENCYRDLPLPEVLPLVEPGARHLSNESGSSRVGPEYLGTRD